MKITNIHALQILDSRGNPTIQVKVELSSGAVGIASVPSGASTGQYEAYELRDSGSSYMGKGVTAAVKNVNTIIRDELLGRNACEQARIDEYLCELDGTPNKSRLGANALLGVSLATARAASAYYDMPLYRYIGGIAGNVMPMPMMNILNGGAHSNNNVDIQEFMVVPVGASSFEDCVRMSCEVFHGLKAVIAKHGGITSVGDEGGFAPTLSSNEEAIDLICQAIEKTGYSLKSDFMIAIDAAASEWQTSDGSYKMPKSGTEYTSEKLISYWSELIKRYPIASIEDPLGEDDWDGWSILTKKIGDKVQLVGDDLFVTNTSRLKEGIAKNAGNAILIKVNQIGTLTQTLEAINIAQKNGYGVIISHRSGETEDTTIADLAVATNAGQIKTGAPSRSDRTAKYNRLLAISEEIHQ